MDSLRVSVLAKPQLRGLMCDGRLNEWLKVSEEVRLFAAAENSSTINLIFEDSKRLAPQNYNDGPFT